MERHDIEAAAVGIADVLRSIDLGEVEVEPTARAYLEGAHRALGLVLGLAT